MKLLFSRLRGLLLVILSSKQLLFILSFLLSIIVLEVYVDGSELVSPIRTIGCVAILSLLFVLILLLTVFILGLLNKNDLKSSVSQKGVGGLNVSYVFIIIVAAVLISALRIYVDLKQEVAFRGSQFCSTQNECDMELYVTEEPKEYHEYLRLNMSTLEDADGGIEISVPRTIDISLGSVCNVVGKLEEPKSFDDFDYVSYLRRQRIYYTIPFPSIECFSVEDRRKGSDLRNWLVDMKSELIQILEKNIPEPQVSLLAGILFGERRLFSDDFDFALKSTGTTHIVAASGYNVTILILLVEKLFRFLSKKWRIVASIFVIWCFCLLSGISPSIVRATIMGTLFLLSVFVGNKGNIHNIFFMSIAIFLFLDPRILFSIGFQFSVLSVIGLLYLAPILEIVVLKFFSELFHSFIREYLVGTLSCTLFVLPLSVYVFGKLSYVSVLANMLILPVLESTMVLGVLGLVVWFISPFLGNLLFLLSWVQLKYFEIIVIWLSSISGVVLMVDITDKPVVLVLIYVFLFILIVRFYPDDGENYYLSRSSVESIG